jgi:hypothetical protein
MTISSSNRSIPEVLADAMNQFTILVRKETQLARKRSAAPTLRGLTAIC